MQLDKLPAAIITKIITHLSSYPDRIHLGAVNRNLRELAYQWPDVAVVDIRKPQDLDLLKQFARLSNLKRLCIDNVSVGHRTREQFDEISGFLGQTVNELQISYPNSNRLFVFGFLGMPKLQKLSLYIYYLSDYTGVILKLEQSTIEVLELNIEALDDRFQRFSARHMPAGLKTLELTVRDPSEELNHLNQLPISLTRLDIRFLVDNVWRLRKVDFAYLVNLREFSVNSRRWKFLDFVAFLNDFVNDRLPSSLKILDFSDVQCVPSEINVAERVNNGAASVEFTGPFPVKRSDFQNLTYAIAKNRPNPLLIRIRYRRTAKKTNDIDRALSEIAVHQKLSFSMLPLS